MSRRLFRLTELLFAGLTVVLGWIALVVGGWTSAGLPFVIGGAVLALAGLVIVARTERHSWLAVGLTMVVVSPTGFGAPVNAIVLLFAIVELAWAARVRRRDADGLVA